MICPSSSLVQRPPLLLLTTTSPSLSDSAIFPFIESMVVFGKSRTLGRLRRFLEAQKKLAINKR